MGQNGEEAEELKNLEWSDRAEVAGRAKKKQKYIPVLFP